MWFITWLILTNSNWKPPIEIFWNQKKMITGELGHGWFKVTRNMKPQKVKVRITFRQRVNWHIYRLHYLGARWYFCPFWPSLIIKEACWEKSKRKPTNFNLTTYKGIIYKIHQKVPIISILKPCIFRLYSTYKFQANFFQHIFNFSCTNFF